MSMFYTNKQDRKWRMSVLGFSTALTQPNQYWLRWHKKSCTDFCKSRLLRLYLCEEVLPAIPVFSFKNPNMQPYRPKCCSMGFKITRKQKRSNDSSGLQIFFKSYPHTRTQSCLTIQNGCFLSIPLIILEIFYIPAHSKSF